MKYKKYCNNLCDLTSLKVNDVNYLRNFFYALIPCDKLVITSTNNKFTHLPRLFTTKISSFNDKSSKFNDGPLKPIVIF